MIPFHAVMIDETGCAFGVSVEALSRGEAYDQLAEDYPESQIIQLESRREDTIRREAQMYDHISRGGDWDDDGYGAY